jgi:hypothetical protein
MRNETPAQTQVRLLLEQQTAALFVAVWSLLERSNARCHCTVLGFDFGGPGPYHNVSFKTTLSMPGLVETAEAMLERWRTGQPGPPEPGVTLPPPAVLYAARDVAAEAMPGLGFSVLLGRGTTSVYVANAERSTVAAMLRDDLLPVWRVRP